MKTLLILRHAKSSWSDPGLADFDRPLNERGLRTAPFMGSLIISKGHAPSIILSSPATRARQTAELARSGADLSAEIVYDERIYEANPLALTQVVSELDDSINSAMVVGHNPGMEGFVRHLTGENEAMPTTALAVVKLGIDSWKAINSGCGKLSAIYRPKDEIADALHTDGSTI